MNLRKIAVGLTALALLSAGVAESRSLFDLRFFSPPTKQESQQESRSGSISQREALALYSSGQKRASFDACTEQFPAAKPLELDRVRRR
jgi:endonuclease G